MTEQQYETDTHEQRQLKDFQISDYIVIRGTEYRVLMMSERSPFIYLMCDDLHGSHQVLSEHRDMLFTARKRDPEDHIDSMSRLVQI